MLRTLQGYITREMGRTTLLTAVGLTLLLATGGSVINIIDVDQISAEQLAQIMAILLPVSATIALPVAALFGAAAAYGRLSADNEFQACSSSGINIQRLLMPAFAIALVSAVITFFLINYYIPNRIRMLDDLLRTDPAGLVQSALQNPRRLLITQNVKAYADDVEAVPLDDGTPIVRLKGAALIKLDDDGWRMYGTAEQIDARISQDGMFAELERGTIWDATEGRFMEEGHLIVGKERIPQLSSVRHRLNWLTLGELFEARTNPLAIPAVLDGLEKLRRAIAVELAYQAIVDSFGASQKFVLADASGRYEITAKEGFTEGDSFRPTFHDVQIKVTEGSVVRNGRAGTLSIEAEPQEDSHLVDLTLKLTERVEWTRSSNLGQKVTKNSDQLGPIVADVKGLDAYSNARLMDADRPLQLGDALDHQHSKLLKGIGAQLRSVAGVIHSRLAFSMSVLVLVVLAAALGIIFRGGHILVAFGISFVPALFVTVMIIMGRQLSQHENTEPTGLGLMWLAIVVVLTLDAVVVGRVLRR